MENSNITLNLETYLELINTYKELNQIKNLIEDNITYEKDNLSFKNAWTFQEDLLKLFLHHIEGCTYHLWQ